MNTSKFSWTLKAIVTLVLVLASGFFFYSSSAIEKFNVMPIVFALLFYYLLIALAIVGVYFAFLKNKFSTFHILGVVFIVVGFLGTLSFNSLYPALSMNINSVPNVYILSISQLFFAVWFNFFHLSAWTTFFSFVFTPILFTILGLWIYKRGN